MSDELAKTLLTQGGIAVFTALIIRLLIKNALRTAIGLPPSDSGEPEDPKLKAKYSMLLNLIAVVCGVGLALIAAAILVGLNSETALSAVLIGLLGAASAVGVSEFGSNTASFRE